MTDKMKLKSALSGKSRLLVYFASGTEIKECYYKLPFELIILVDVAFKKPLKIAKNVVCVGLWSTNAISLFKELEISISCMATGIDGLEEGGCAFPMNGNFCIGSLLPILKNDFLHIAFPKQYRRSWKKLFLDMPFTSTLLNQTDKDYIDPKIFSSTNKAGYVWRVTKNVEPPTNFKLGGRNITIQRKSIWDNYESLDKLFVRCPPIEARNVKKLFPKAEIIKDFTFEGILQYCNRNNVSSIGLSPWLRHEYKAFLQYLLDNEEKNPLPRVIHFNHLHRNDFAQVYNLAKQSSISA
ncbi:hypothetical protein [Rufibacter sp. XAAS-G3-1]|uniref:hypothetical protein n=1 Tax=Rufibacter sp. XAAS-G3-1 TaxID=2729134 RepID=UPI0015E63E88|nr:hypothetical protein [Rufibacter sp. XAAS-G3-1]